MANTKNQKKKKPYEAPQVDTKPMTVTFGVCAGKAKDCPPGTAIRQAGKCF